MIRAILARTVLFFCYAKTRVLANLIRAILPARTEKTGRLLLTGTFFHTQWLTAHTRGLIEGGVSEVHIVADSPLDVPLNVQFHYPPKILRRMMGRAVSKFLWTVRVGQRLKPDLVMGFHIFPSGLTALLAARLIGAKACYQCTGGPIEIEGGGYKAENRLLSALQAPSRFVERQALAVVKQFDLVIVRGPAAVRYFCENDAGEHVYPIPAAICECGALPVAKRCYDLVFVGRLAPIKRPRLIMDIIDILIRDGGNPSCAMVGDGPLGESLRAEASQRGFEKNVRLFGQSEETGRIVSQAKIFILPSVSEGLSIALGEAMASGCVPVVSRVGELATLVIHSENGYLVDGEDASAFAGYCGRLLADNELWQRYSQEAKKRTMEVMSVEAVAGKWRQALAGMSDDSN